MSFDVQKLPWKYITEGGSNIILSSGKYVLRIRKCGNKRNKSKLGNTFSIIEEEIFFENVVKPLFSDTRYLTENICIGVNEKFLRNLSVKIAKYRPKTRQFCSIDYSVDYALLMPNLAYLPNFSSNCIAVEIKPKCGFLPSFYTELSEFPFKNNICRFCMHQRLKLREGRISKISDYCPINLYARCSCRVQSALSGLLHSPQNNFSVMFGGNRVNEEFLVNNSPFGIDSSKSLIDILTSIIYNDSIDPDDKQHGDLPDKERHDFCEDSPTFEHSGDCYSFGKNGIFQKLKRIQEWDESGLEKIMEIYKLLKSKSDFDVKDFSNFSSNLWKNFINCGTAEDKNIYSMLRYLVSSTIKDITVIITLAELPSQNIVSLAHQTVKWNGKRFVYDIKIVDLDPKYIHNIPFYYELDRKIALNYLNDKSQNEL